VLLATVRGMRALMNDDISESLAVDIKTIRVGTSNILSAGQIFHV
jgi:hypothetical protein